MRRTSMVGLIAVAVAVVALAAPAAFGRLLSPGERLMGMSYEQWDIEWGQAQAKRSIQSKNSLIAVRGNKCGLQVAKAWLLPVSVTTSTSLTFTCAIPRGLHLVFPVAGVVWWGMGPNKLRQLVNRDFKAIKSVSLSFDGEALSPPIASTPMFHVTVGYRNGLGVPAGTVSMMSKDYFAILTPPAPGRHTIVAGGVFDVPGQGIFELTSTFNLTVR